MKATRSPHSAGTSHACQAPMGGARVTDVARLWVPLALWLGFIALTSGTAGARANTDDGVWHLLASWLAGLLGGEGGSTTIAVLSWVVRKAAHVVQYAVLGVVACQSYEYAGDRRGGLWAGRGGRGQGAAGRGAAAILLFGALVALGDELHQATIPVRTGSWGDALLDVAGVALGLSLVWRRSGAAAWL